MGRMEAKDWASHWFMKSSPHTVAQPTSGMDLARSSSFACPRLRPQHLPGNKRSYFSPLEGTHEQIVWSTLYLGSNEAGR